MSSYPTPPFLIPIPVRAEPKRCPYCGKELPDEAIPRGWWLPFVLILLLAVWALSTFVMVLDADLNGHPPTLWRIIQQQGRWLAHFFSLSALSISRELFSRNLV